MAVVVIVVLVVEAAMAVVVAGDVTGVAVTVIFSVDSVSHPITTCFRSQSKRVCLFANRAYTRAYTRAYIRHDVAWSYRVW